MQIVGKPKKLKSREPLILLGLRRVIQVVLPLGSSGVICAGSSPVTRTNNERAVFVALLLFYVEQQKDLNLLSAKPNTIGRSRSE